MDIRYLWFQSQRDRLLEVVNFFLSLDGNLVKVVPIGGVAECLLHMFPFLTEEAVHTTGFLAIEDIYREHGWTIHRVYPVARELFGPFWIFDPRTVLV